MWSIYLPISSVYFYGKLVGKYSSPMDLMGYESLRISPEDFSVPGVSGNLKGSSLTKSGKTAEIYTPKV